ncbi:MAG: hypothetical protein JW883_16965 [Deltaproteobacteria bacterium]|nr:hypothetical protein [Deltaproteobacteria bacterium]
MKKVWLTSLVSSEDMVKKLMAQMKTYGLELHGHFWEDDLKKMAWMKAREELVNPQIIFWAILGSEENLRTPSIRYGLSLLSITLQAQRGLDFPIVILQTEGEPVASDSLTTSLKGVEILSASSATLGAKLVARAHASVKEEMSSEYRLDLYGNEHVGQWFEVGPTEVSWSGGMFAVADAEIAFHGVGPKGSLPSKSVLNYPVEGLKLNLGEKEYTAWAVQNELNAETSYFVKVTGSPESILFGPYSSEEDTEVFVVKLK